MSLLHDHIRFHAATDVGRVRSHNEDNFLVDKKLSLFMVADGMGGHAAGEIASAIAVRTVHEELKQRRELGGGEAARADGATALASKETLALLEDAVQQACAKIHSEAQADPSRRGMGTTLSALLLLPPYAFIAHVGDSRIYLLRDKRAHQITEDHTVQNELLKFGKLTREQLARVAQQKDAITRALGVYERVEIDTLVLEVLPGDTFVLASDGLTRYLQSTEELEQLLRVDGDAAAKALIGLANSRGGKDNITAVIVHVGAEGVLDETRARRLALKREVMANMPLFSRLIERELLRVMQVVEVRPFSDAQVVIREGERGDELFIVLTGSVCVSRRDTVITRLGAGEHFGEMALIRSMPRSATVTSVGDTELLVIRRSDFFELLREEHAIAVKMLWRFLGVLAERLDQTSSELHSARAERAGEDENDIFCEIEAE